MTAQVKSLIDEADIGSGDKTPGQHDTEKMIEQIGESRHENAHQKDGTKQNTDSEQNKGVLPKKD
ncbi:MAG: hypothetical protein JWQ21_1906 [Herminiimonas sp.]|nr:hypothetical protein [Herminiimonas sp.]